MAPGAAILGLPGAWAENALEACSHYTTKVGGVPSWPPGAEAIVPKEWLTCKACGQALKLVVQAYAPLHVESSGIPERTLYVFGCVASDCGHSADSWRVFRFQSADPIGGPETPAAALDTTSHHPFAAETVARERCQHGPSAERRPSNKTRFRDAPNISITSAEGSDVSRLETAGAKPDKLDGNGAALSNGAGVGASAQMFDADVRCGDTDKGTPESGGAGDDWGAGDASWGDAAGDEWSAAGSALDMRALSEAIADAADKANRKSASPEETAGVSDRHVTSGGAVDMGAGDASGAGRSDCSSAERLEGPGAERSDGLEAGTSDGAGTERSDGLRTSVLPCFYVVAGEEPGEKKGKAAQVSSSVDESPGEESWEGEGYEYDNTRSADRTFLRFRKRIERAPEQCIRYGFQSQPLLARALSSPPPPCPACGAPRTFEMQLMPPLAYFLAEASEEAAEHVAGWEWLTLLVFTCSKACTVPGGSQHVAVQEEVLVYQHELEATKGY